MVQWLALWLTSDAPRQHVPHMGHRPHMHCARYQACKHCVTAAQAEGLKGSPRHTHTFVRVKVSSQSQLTSVQWSSLAPQWDEVLTFK